MVRTPSFPRSPPFVCVNSQMMDPFMSMFDQNPRPNPYAMHGAPFHGMTGLHAPSVPRANLPCGHPTGGRNLIVCIDGTANQFGDENTNVIEMYRMIDKLTSDRQHTWYNSGIGTYAQPHWRSLSYYRQVVSHWADMAIAWNFEKTVQDAYRWLSNKYQEGDCIFLFGFSRGAFQVRVLAAMIDKVGLIHEGNEAQIPFAYELYADPRTGDGGTEPVGDSAGSMPKGLKGMNCKAARFKAAFSREVQVHFVGAWDTVSSIGFARGNKILPGTTDGMTQVCYFRHALALDERRVKFQPEYAYGGSATARPSAKADGDLVAKPAQDATNIPSTLKDTKPQTLEVWFAGTHSDIGGGNAYNAEMNRSRPPLRWMAHEAKSLGLRIKKFERDLTVDEQINFVESLTWFWWIFEIIPFLRLAFFRSPEAWGQTTYRPHLGAGRMVHEGQKIHSSFLFGKATYTPKASLPTGSGLDSPDPWSQLREEGVAKRHGLLEMDMTDYTRTTLRAFSDKPDSNLRGMLERIVEYGSEAQVLYDEIIKMTEQWSAGKATNVVNQYEVLDMALLVLGPKARTLTLRDGLNVHPSLFGGDNGQDERMVAVARSFFRQLTSTCKLKLNAARESVTSVSFSSDGTRIASGLGDQTVRVWDAQTGQLLRALEGCTGRVLCVAFSSDGTRITSASDDESMRVWDVQTGDLLRELKRPKEVPKTSLSPGGPSPVTTMYDKQLISYGGFIPLVFCVAFSSDGTRIASGSNDKSIRIWDERTGNTPMRLEGHTETVSSVAFSSDGTRIVSGSHDKTVRVWDAQTGQLLRTLHGHTGWVLCVAFSPNGNRIVSGSNNKSTRVWDVETGDLLRELREGAPRTSLSPGRPRRVSGVYDKRAASFGGLVPSVTGLDSYEVLCVAFSPDRTRIVSGSTDAIVRVWDVRTWGLPRELEGHTGRILSVAFSSDGTSIVSGSRDESIRIWDVQD